MKNSQVVPIYAFIGLSLVLNCRCFYAKSIKVFGLKILQGNLSIHSQSSEFGAQNCGTVLFATKNGQGENFSRCLLTFTKKHSAEAPTKVY